MVQYHSHMPKVASTPNSEDNYFDAITRSINTSLMLEVKEQVDKTVNEEFVPAKQQSLEIIELSHK